MSYGASAIADRAAGLRPQPPSAFSRSSIPCAVNGDPAVAYIYQRPRITASMIQKIVADYYGVHPAQMLLPDRHRRVARPRQIAMYLARQLVSTPGVKAERRIPMTLPDIGRAFGGRDHSTVIHAIKTVEAMRANNEDVRLDIELLKVRIAG